MCWICDDLNRKQEIEAQKPEVKEKELKGHGLGVVIYLADKAPVPADKTKTEK